jgi:hypothetical protein
VGGYPNAVAVGARTVTVTLLLTNVPRDSTFEGSPAPRPPKPQNSEVQAPEPNQVDR